MRTPKPGETFAVVSVSDVIITSVVHVDNLRNTATVKAIDSTGERTFIIRQRKVGNSIYEAIAEG